MGFTCVWPAAVRFKLTRWHAAGLGRSHSFKAFFCHYIWRVSLPGKQKFLFGCLVVSRWAWGEENLLNHCELYLGFPSADRLLLIGLKVYWFLFLSSLFHLKRLFWRFKEKKNLDFLIPLLFVFRNTSNVRPYLARIISYLFLKYNFIYFWLCWVLVAARFLSGFRGRLSPSWGDQAARCGGFSFWSSIVVSSQFGALLFGLSSCGAGLVVPHRAGSSPTRDQSLVSSLPLSPQGGPRSS